MSEPKHTPGALAAGRIIAQRQYETDGDLTKYEIAAIIDAETRAPDLLAENQRLRARCDLDQTTAAEVAEDYEKQLLALREALAQLRIERDDFAGQLAKLDVLYSKGLVRFKGASPHDEEIMWRGFARAALSAERSAK